jgi:RNA polymerase subunit RPABC4/transcription elongation factor Spt4
MAMVNCRECEHAISQKASTCPSCGAPNKKKTSLFAWFFVVVMLFFVFSLLTSPKIAKRNASPGTIAVEKSASDQVSPTKKFDSTIKRTAPSQDSITPINDPEAFNISSCIKASYYAYDFSATEWKNSSKWRYAMFEKLGIGRYAPNGKFVVANYNLYESTQGKSAAAAFIWDSFNCSEHL